MYVCMYVCMHACMYEYIYIYIYIYTYRQTLFFEGGWVFVAALMWAAQRWNSPPAELQQLPIRCSQMRDVEL